LLRILGASRGQIIAITALEYLFAGSLAALTGVILAVIAGWGLTYYFFAALSVPPLLTVFSGVLSVSLIAIAAGLLGCWGMFNCPALETLRAEL
jgi:putative ABC transport system permease protein